MIWLCAVGFSEEDCLHQFATPPLPFNPLETGFHPQQYPFTTPNIAHHGPTRLSGDTAIANHDVRHQKLLQPGEILGKNTRGKLGTDALTMQAKNVVLNVSEMEAKVREATNDDPWCVYQIIALFKMELKHLLAGARVRH